MIISGTVLFKNLIAFLGVFILQSYRYTGIYLSHIPYYCGLRKVVITLQCLVVLGLMVFTILMAVNFYVLF